MDLASIALIGILVFIVLLGTEIAPALGIISILALLFTGVDFDVILSFLGSTGYEVLRDYVYAVIPLFILMGLFIAKSGAASDLYTFIERWLRKIPGCLAHATVLGNLVFGFVTGTSVAAAISFTTIAYPEMKRFGYNSAFQLGLIAGSACLGMLIPPSVLLIIWGILTDQSIGQLFLAGIIPGVFLTLLMLLYISIAAWLKPEWVGRSAAMVEETFLASAHSTSIPSGREGFEDKRGMLISGIGFLSIIVVALGGIWFGFLTPTEGSGVGALFALILGLAKGMRWKDIEYAILETARTSTPILAILFAAQLYARTLSMSGIGSSIEMAMLNNPYGEIGIIGLMLLIWFLLGMLIDSISIMLLTVPIFEPVAYAIGIDPIVFAIIGVLTIEAGLLTPPLGINVYAVKGVVPDSDVTMTSVFIGAVPFWAMLVILVPLFLGFPTLLTFVRTLV